MGMYLGLSLYSLVNEAMNLSKNFITKRINSKSRKRDPYLKYNKYATMVIFITCSYLMCRQLSTIYDDYRKNNVKFSINFLMTANIPLVNVQTLPNFGDPGAIDAYYPGFRRIVEAINNNKNDPVKESR